VRYTITDDFDKHFDVGEWHGTNAYIREGDPIFRTYFIDNGGDEQMGNTWNYLEIAALGRHETVGGRAGTATRNQRRTSGGTTTTCTKQANDRTPPRRQRGQPV
jgi:predicted dithiol-disulfide oxidoreductase (DUF899 family)